MMNNGFHLPRKVFLQGIGVSRGWPIGQLPTNFFEMMAIAQCQKILLPAHVRRLKLYDFNALSLDEI
jgi:hypothetical protein